MLGAAPISHGDPDAAVALLDEAGWTLNLSMKREKDGEELAVNMVAYPHRPGLVIMQPVMEGSPTALGIEVTTTFTGDEWSETQVILDGRIFDLMMWAQYILPAGDLLWVLSAFSAATGGATAWGLSRPQLTP